jgi:short chain dehydrogenase
VSVGASIGPSGARARSERRSRATSSRFERANDETTRQTNEGETSGQPADPSRLPPSYTRHPPILAAEILTTCTGIGAAIALALAQAGAHLILVLRSPQSATTTLDALRSCGASASASVVYAELSDREQVKTVFARALAVLKQETGRERIDIFVHAAGIQRRAPAVQFTDEAWDEVRAAAHAAHAVHPIYLYN